MSLGNLILGLEDIYFNNSFPCESILLQSHLFQISPTKVPVSQMELWCSALHSAQCTVHSAQYTPV